MTSLKKQTFSGIKWAFAGNAAQKVISFVGIAILARILDPAEFGLFALAFIMINALTLFKSLGFDSALIRRKDDFDKASNTAFFLIPSMGMLLFAILLIIAPIGARFLNKPEVTPIIRALGIIFVISCFGKVPQAALYRDMKFKYKYISEILSKLIYIVTAIILALNKFGVWSLVIGYILKMAVEAGVQWYYSGWTPKFEFDKKIAWDMFHFGKFVLSGSIVAFLYGNLDNIVIGKFLGVTLLGYYAIARNTSYLLSQYFLGKTSMILFPAYSKIQHDKGYLRKTLFKSLTYLSIIVFPFGIGLFIYAPDVLRIVFGEKWLPATDILRILAIASIFKSLPSAIRPIFLARGKSKADFQVSLAEVVAFFILLIPLVSKFKLIGVGLAVLISTFFSFLVTLIRVNNIINIKFSKIFDSIKLALLCSLLMFPTSALLKMLILTGNININFFIAAGASILIYFVATYFSNRNSLIEIKNSFI